MVAAAGQSEIRTGDKCRGIRSVHHFSCHRFAGAQACAVFHYTKCCHIANEERAATSKGSTKEKKLPAAFTEKMILDGATRGKLSLTEATQGQAMRKRSGRFLNGELPLR